ncbi:MAG: SufS family cysteine desulfurase [Gemmatimonadaceae bacterium]|jgi:cysteine desulfurase/selenocysteine lyase|nr:SufS family cysteine desulfurase [Gemmatimonadaceae bacterium]
MTTSLIAEGTTAHASLAPRHDFPLLAEQPALRYLDSAATSQKPQVVLDALTGFYATANANPHRGAYALSAAATDAYHAARATIARFLGAADPETLVFTRGTTEAMNLVANAWGAAHVQAGDEIVVTALEHHANFIPWQQLAKRTGATFRIVELTADQRIDLDHLASLLSSRTRVVAITHVSNAVGAITPVHEVVRLVRAHTNALLVLDGAQGAPHLPVAFDTLGVDFYAFSGHKMLGPMGIGGVIGTRARWAECQPWQFGGDMIEWVHDQDSTWNVLPYRFEAGTPNAADAVGLAAGVQYLAALDMAAVRAHELALLDYAHARLADVEGLHIFGPPPAERSGVLSFALADVHPHDLATILDEHGVCIRAGHHCAQPLMRRLGVSATARASLYVYTDARDIDALVDALVHARRIFGATS